MTNTAIKLAGFGIAAAAIGALIGYGLSKIAKKKQSDVPSARETFSTLDDLNNKIIVMTHSREDDVIHDHIYIDGVLQTDLSDAERRLIHTRMMQLPTTGDCITTFDGNPIHWDLAGMQLELIHQDRSMAISGAKPLISLYISTDRLLNEVAWNKVPAVTIVAGMINHCLDTDGVMLNERSLTIVDNMIRYMIDVVMTENALAADAAKNVDATEEQEAC